MARLKKAIQFLWVPTLGLALLGWGFGGKRIPGVDVMLSHLETWLRNNTDYPSLVVAGTAILLVWGGYQIWRYVFLVKKERWRSRLLTLLREGVELRNLALNKVKTRAAAEKWIASARAWKKKVVNEIENREPNEAEDFSLVDWAPPAREPIKNRLRVFKQQYELHDYRLVKLRKLTDYMRAPN